MMSAEVETLFSLELAVESLRLIHTTTTCRVPAVAFRLLDFPSLIIEQLDHIEAAKLKTGIQQTWYDSKDVPHQFTELKDRFGNHEFNKGKSSLFKFNIDSLESHLINTPLYVMIVDTWSEVPKLIGHCNISLKDAMSNIKKDIAQFGISVPSVHGSQGKFPIFNLMESEIGWISLGFRLLSLGGNLIPHIPDAALTKRKTTQSDAFPQTELNTKESKSVVNNPAPVLVTSVMSERDKRTHDPRLAEVKADIVVEDVEICESEDVVAAGKQYVSVIQNKPSVNDTSRRKHRSKTSPSVKQTSKPDHDKRMFPDACEQDVNDIFITNMHVPPPLFFNSENEPQDKQRTVNRSMPVSKHLQHYKENTSDAESESSHSLSFPGARKEIETHYILHPPEFHSSPNVRKVLRSRRKAGAKGSVHDEKSESKAYFEKSKSALITDDVQAEFAPEFPEIAHLQRLPILNALLRELSLLHGNERHAQQYGHSTFSVRNQRMEETTHASKEKSVHQQSRLHDKENLEIENQQLNKELSNLHTKTKTKKGYRHKHSECAKHPQAVPASKGWLRQQPVYGKRKTKLQFKVTHSQKLRLQKHNPDALRSLEEKERLAEIQFQMSAAHQMQQQSAQKLSGSKSRHAKSAQHRNGSSDHLAEQSFDYPDTNLPTEISRHLDVVDPSTVQDDHQFTGLGLATFKIPAKHEPEVTEDRKDTAESRKPVPTPRHSQLSFNLDGLDSDTANQVTHQKAPMANEKDVSGSEKSVRSIDVYLPTASVQKDQQADSYDDESSSLDDEEEIHPKGINVPGFSSESLQEEDKDEINKDQKPSPVASEYSDDFEGSFKLESTGEQELASIHSSNASGRFSNEQPSRDDHNGSAHSRDSELSHQSGENSFKTAPSVKSQQSTSAKGSDVASKASAVSSAVGAKSSGSSSKYASGVLSIPQPQMSANSPIPVTRHSSKSAALDAKPKPKPRLSLDRSLSTVSTGSLLTPDINLSDIKTGSTMNSSDFRPGYYDDEQDDKYSDDFDSDDN